MNVKTNKQTKMLMKRGRDGNLSTNLLFEMVYLLACRPISGAPVIVSQSNYLCLPVSCGDEQPTGCDAKEKPLTR